MFCEETIEEVYAFFEKHFDEIDVLREAENLINNNIESEQVSLLKFNLKRLKHKYKWVKLKGKRK